MEMLILQTLDFNLGAPTSHLFVQRYLKAAESEQLSSSSATSPSHMAILLHQTVTSLSMVSHGHQICMYMYMLVLFCLHAKSVCTLFGVCMRYSACIYVAKYLSVANSS